MHMRLKLLTIIGSLAVSSTLLTGCARKPQNPQDPYESFNRAMFAFNMKVDRYVLRPATRAYDTVTPAFAQRGVTNFFNNTGELTTIPNDLLQGKAHFMLNDFWRLVINTTLGVGGLFDVASHIGLRHHVNNFGLTLAYWEGGKHVSPYLVLPFTGPGTFRSHFGRVVDIPTTPYFYINERYWAYMLGARGLHLLSDRNALMGANKLIDTAYDPYVFVRNAYLKIQKTRTTRSLNEKFSSGPILSQDHGVSKNNTQNNQPVKPNTTKTSHIITQHQATSEGYVFD
jgi:phospholipid-binding lipoprotein MlaA